MIYKTMIQKQNITGSFIFVRLQKIKLRQHTNMGL